MIVFLRTPFPRPEYSTKNIGRVFLLGVITSLFVIIFQPFDIRDKTGIWYFELLVFLLGLIFSLAIYVMEFLIPSVFSDSFKNWNIGKAMLWYSWLILFVSGVMFFSKSFLSDFNDFTATEFFMVIGRIVVLSLVVSFFSLGMYAYLRREKIDSVASSEWVKLTGPNAKPLTLRIKEILYIASADNYVDIHTLAKGGHKKFVFRSSLKNIEDQLVGPITPIYRCHRRFLINVQHFEIGSDKSRNVTVVLKNSEVIIPVSNKYATEILGVLPTRH